MNVKRKTFTLAMVLCLALIALTACSDSNGSSPGSTPANYRITVTNITNDQPLSPIAVILHQDGYSVWSAGDAASLELETLAESGDPADLLNEASQDVNVLTSVAGNGIILPGEADMVDLSVTSSGSVLLSVATMLVNTNDAFAGVTGTSLNNLAVGQSVTLSAPAYDAGTEANTEDAGSVPGPAAGGQGFDAARNDRDFVVVHPGVVSAEDGLSGSALDDAHRWDNPVIKLTVKRTG